VGRVYISGRWTPAHTSGARLAQLEPLRGAGSGPRCPSTPARCATAQLWPARRRARPRPSAARCPPGAGSRCARLRPRSGSPAWEPPAKRACRELARGFSRACAAGAPASAAWMCLPPQGRWRSRTKHVWSGFCAGSPRARRRGAGSRVAGAFAVGLRSRRGRFRTRARRRRARLHRSWPHHRAWRGRAHAALLAGDAADKRSRAARHDGRGRGEGKR